MQLTLPYDERSEFELLKNEVAGLRKRVRELEEQEAIAKTRLLMLKDLLDPNNMNRPDLLGSAYKELYEMIELVFDHPDGTLRGWAADAWDIKLEEK